MEITTTTNPNVTIPLLDFRGIATGILVRDRGADHREDAGLRDLADVDAGITNPPVECFENTLVAFAKAVGA